MNNWLGGVLDGHRRLAMRCSLCGRGRSSEGQGEGTQDGMVGQAYPCLVVVLEYREGVHLLRRSVATALQLECR
jgi:hypothetical protein